MITFFENHLPLTIFLTFVSLIIFLIVLRGTQGNKGEKLSLSTNPIISEISEYLQKIKKIDSGTEYQLDGEYCELLQRIASSFQSLVDKYQNSNLIIERFSSKYFRFISQPINKKYTIGEFHNEPPEPLIFYSQFSTLINSLKKENFKDFYNSLLDTVFLIDNGKLPNTTSNKLSVNMKRELAVEFSQNFDFLISRNVYQTGNRLTKFLITLKEYITTYQDSHLLSFYNLIQSKTFFETRATDEVAYISYLVENWFSAWAIGDIRKEYLFLARIWTEIQKSYTDESLSEYILPNFTPKDFRSGEFIDGRIGPNSYSE
ncbi:hypothetical protein JR338_07170 [Chloroflexota bacterium]|nr:hypothetical protein JR338_07170 [Chloroflexota bacterium]